MVASTRSEDAPRRQAGTLLAPLIAIVDTSETIVHWSDSCVAWTGRSRADVRGKKLLDALGNAADASSRISWTRAAVPLAEGGPQTVVMGVDRLEQEQAEAGPRLRLSRPLGDRLPMWTFDRGSLAITAVNDAARRAYELSDDELVGLRVPDVFGADDHHRLLDALVDLAGEVVWTGPWRQRGAKTDFGAEIAMVASEEHGRPTGMALVSRCNGPPTSVRKANSGSGEDRGSSVLAGELASKLEGSTDRSSTHRLAAALALNIVDLLRRP